jgi:hypothetical protein
MSVMVCDSRLDGSMLLWLSGGDKKHGTHPLRLNIYTYHTSETKGQEHHPGTKGQGARRVPQKWKKVIHTKAAPKQSRAQ